jgi:hypothetical protein
MGSLPSSGASSSGSGSSAKLRLLTHSQNPLVPEQRDVDMPDLLPLVPDLRLVDNAGQIVTDEGLDLHDYRSCGHAAHALQVSELKFDLVFSAPAPYMGVENCTDAGLSMDTNGSLPVKKCTKCAWIGTNPGGLVSCPNCGSGDCMSEGTPPTQRRTAWYEFYQIVVGAQQSVRNKVREALAMAELWMKKTEMVIVLSSEIVASWNAQRIGNQKELMNGDFDRVFSMLASERGCRFRRDVDEGPHGWNMALHEARHLDAGQDKQQRQKLYKYSEVIDFDTNC